tara:strand:+ start:1632 stop:2384 length:753 start_codon:yes stop_codon:yes gene_type:complete
MLRRPSGCWSRKIACVRACDGSVLICHRQKFGLVTDTPPRLPHNCTINATVLPLQQSFAASCVLRFDLVILSEWAHWAGVDGALGLQRCLEEAGVGSERAARWSQDEIAQLYATQMRRNAGFLRRVLSERTRRTRAFFRTSAPGYPPPDVLPPDMPTRNHEPQSYAAPAQDLSWARVWAGTAQGAESFNHHMAFRLNEAARVAYSAEGLGVMDVEAPMLHRVDGHIDRLHYCLPGPPDFYTHTLYNHVLS